VDYNVVAQDFGVQKQNIKISYWLSSDIPYISKTSLCHTIRLYHHLFTSKILDDLETQKETFTKEELNEYRKCA
jgi:hypothetical protein